MSNIDDAVAAAEAASKQMDNAPAVQEPQGGAITASNSSVDMSLGSFLKSGGLNPDKWITVKDTGLKLDKLEKATIEEFTGVIDFANVKLFQGLRVNLPGGKYEYLKTYDGKTESRSGQNWGAAVAEANGRASEKATPYRGADILVTLEDDVVQGKTTIPAGTKLGYTTSVTGWSGFQSFLQSLVADNKVTVAAGDILAGVVKTRVFHESRSNSDYEWGVLNFEAL